MQNCIPETKEEYEEQIVDRVKAVRTHVLIERNIETRIMMLCFNRRKTKKCSHNALNILNTGYTEFCPLNMRATGTKRTVLLKMYDNAFR